MSRRPLFLSLAAATLLLAGCAGGPPPQAAAPPCSCSKYQAAKPRPAWVDRSDHVTPLVFQSTGLAACTGVQTLDTEKADLSARSKLSRVLSSRFDVRISETRTDTGSGAGYAQAAITATQISQTVVEGSRIFDRWVDPASCTVYAGVELSAAKLAEAKAEIERAEKARLVNQAFFVTAKGPHAARLQAAAAQLMSEAGVTRLPDSKAGASHVLEAAFAPLENTPTLVRGRVTLRLTTADGSLVWTQTLPAKGLSYRETTPELLAERAITAGMERMAAPLRRRLMQ